MGSDKGHTGLRGGVTWEEMKTEYITTATSYRKLAAKYGVSDSAIKYQANKDGWVAERTRYRNETYAQTMEAIGKNQVERAVRLQDVTDKVLQKIETLVEEVDVKELPSQSIRALTAALKDIKAIQGVKSSLDEQEQQARIDNLRRQSQKEDDAAGTVEVIFHAGEEKWNE